MRHVVNFGLLFAFGTLAVTGVMAFALPFSIATTRVHLVAAAATILLVGLHLAERTAYFKRQLTGGPGGARIARGALAALTFVWALLLAAAMGNWPPVSLLIEQGYEARHRASIVRTSPLAGFDETANRRLVARAAGDGAEAGLALHVGFGPAASDGALPAMAVWAETTTGAMIETLYLDPRLAYEKQPDWGGKPTPRHHILPIWRQRHTLVSGVDPHGEVDAFTATTPTHSFTLESYLKLGEKKEFVLCVEVNAPGDSNEHFEDPHLGQPSTLYTAYIRLDAPQPYTLLELTGHGGVPDQRGEVRYDLERITTARDLIDLLLARVTPEPAPEKTP